MRKFLLQLAVEALCVALLIWGVAALADSTVLAPIATMEVSAVTRETPVPGLQELPMPSPTPYRVPLNIMTYTVTQMPTPAATATPTPEPTPTATPEPTATPMPEPSPTAAPTATQEATPEATAELEPTQTPWSVPASVLEAQRGKLMSERQPATALAVGGIFAGESTVLGSDIPRSAVLSVRFADSLQGAAADAWDVSAARDGSVLAWMEDGALTIAAEGGVKANEDSSNLFAGYASAMRIDFNGCFHTETATDMSHMFENCWSLSSLDVTQLDTSNVRNMAYMFNSCPELTNLDVSGFDTAKVASMEGMFLLDAKLEALDLSGFDTGAVTNMHSMFESCSAIRELDLTNFCTRAVADMGYMFSGCAALEQVRFGADFTPPANANEMFGDCPAKLIVDGREMNPAAWPNLGDFTSLKLWSRGDGVRELQTKLSGLGYDLGSIDGVLGHHTQDALKKWQSDHGFEPSGTLDSAQAWELFKE